MFISHGAKLASVSGGRFHEVHHLAEGIDRIFCGHYPSLLYYPDYNTITIGITRESNDDTFIMHTSFSVIDRYVITSLKTQRITRQKLTFDSLNAFDSTLIYVVYSTTVTYAQIYFLKVAQTHHMQVQFFNRTYYKYFVYNGPGFKSKLLKSFANIVVTSSFQCIVEIYGVN